MEFCTNTEKLFAVDADRQHDINKGQTQNKIIHKKVRQLTRQQPEEKWPNNKTKAGFENRTRAAVEHITAALKQHTNQNASETSKETKTNQQTLQQTSTNDRLITQTRQISNRTWESNEATQNKHIGCYLATQTPEGITANTDTQTSMLQKAETLCRPISTTPHSSR